MRHSNTIIAILMAQAVSSLAGAEESPLRRSLQARSMGSALGELPVRRFVARSRTTNQDVQKHVLAALALTPESNAAGAAQPAKPSASAVISQRDFFLEVSENGSQVYYRAKRPRTAAPAGTPQPRPALAELEPRARQLIRERLGAVIRLGASETLDAWNVNYEVAGVGAVGGAQTTELVASTITFTRAIDGIPVLGASSKVRVSYAPDGGLLGVEFDWPELVQLDEERTIPVAHVRHRAESLQRARSGVVSESSLECGYYAQPGSGGVVLEPACVSRYRLSGQEGAMRYADVVPIARQLRVDTDWAEVQLLRELGEPTR